MGKIPLPSEVRSARGFTLIEAVAVLILIGILAAVAIARVTDNDADVRAAQDKLKAHVRFAQMQAMNSELSWGIRATGGSYYLFEDGDESNKKLLPSESELMVDFPSGFNPAFIVSFDQWGRPCTDLAGNTLAGSSIPIGGGMSITPETGFIQ